MKTASQEKRDAILRKAGFTDTEIQQFHEMGRQDGPGSVSPF